jgi:molybdopterin-biosynthesis enzyme MoeA-like protein
MKVEIITIGDEILIGQIVDTNSAWMAQQLNLCGFQCEANFFSFGSRSTYLKCIKRGFK